MRTLTFIARPMLMLLGVATVSGCFSPMPLRNDLKVEQNSNSGIIIQSVRVRQINDGVMVSGTVRRALGYGPTYRSHLDVAILGPEGELRRVVTTKYIPFPIPRTHRTPGRSSYAVEISESVPAGSVIQVSHHATVVRDCPHNLSSQRPAPESARLFDQTRELRGGPV